MVNQHVNGNVVGFRLGEQKQRINFRVQRFFTISHNWFFNTREGVDQGPYINKSVAEKAVKDYIQKMQQDKYLN